MNILSAQKRWKIFFSRNIFSNDFDFFHDCQNHSFGRHFVAQKINFMSLLFKCDYVILTQYLKYALKIYLEKLGKKWW